MKTKRRKIDFMQCQFHGQMWKKMRKSNILKKKNSAFHLKPKIPQTPQMIQKKRKNRSNEPNTHTQIDITANDEWNYKDSEPH